MCADASRKTVITKQSDIRGMSLFVVKKVFYRPVKNTRSTFITMMLDAGVDMGWVAEQVGHTSFKMIYEHYYKHMKKDDPTDKILAYLEVAETKHPEKLVQSWYTSQDAIKN